MRSFGESQKSQKNVASMIEKRGGEDNKQQPNKKSVKIVEAKKVEVKVLSQQNDNSPPQESMVILERNKFIEKQMKGYVKKPKAEKT